MGYKEKITKFLPDDKNKPKDQHDLRTVSLHINDKTCSHIGITLHF